MVKINLGEWENLYVWAEKKNGNVIITLETFSGHVLNVISVTQTTFDLRFSTVWCTTEGIVSAFLPKQV